MGRMRRLHFYLTVFIILLQTLRQLAAAWHHDEKYDAEGWLQAGRFLTGYADESKKACEHFYDRVCGKFVIKPGIAPGGLFQDAFKAELRGILNEKLTEQESSPYSSADTLEQAVVRFYQQCVSNKADAADYDSLRGNLQAAVDLAVKELLVNYEIDDTDQYDHRGDRWRAAGRLWRDLGESLHVTLDDQSQIVYWLEIEPSANNGTLLFILNRLAMRDRPGNWTKSASFDELRSLAPNVEWSAYFDEIFGGSGTSQSWINDPSQATFNIFDAQLLNEVGRRINEMDGTEFEKVVKKSLTQQLEWTLTYSARNARELCTSLLMRRHSVATAEFYLRSIGSSLSEWRSDILTLKRNIFAAFRYLLNSVDWIDDERDKEKIHEKLDEMRFYPGIPDWVNDEGSVMRSFFRRLWYNDTDESIPFSAEFAWIKADRSRMIDGYRTKDHQLRKTTEEIDVVDYNYNAYYSNNLNRIKMTLGFLLPPYYHVRYPMAVKYGSAGFFIGHELIHGFDSKNLKTPSSARREHADSWLTERTWREFEKRKQCLIQQYSSFCVKDKAYCINGTKNLGENMADIDGLRVAYTAFKFAQQVFGADPAIPTMLNYTDDQLFFMSYARRHCGEAWHDVFRTGVHSLSKARVDVAIRNVPVFARAFSCAVGSTYAPLRKRCSVWGDLDNPPADRRKRRSIG